MPANGPFQRQGKGFSGSGDLKRYPTAEFQELLGKKTDASAADVEDREKLGDIVVLLEGDLFFFILDRGSGDPEPGACPFFQAFLDHIVLPYFYHQDKSKGWRKSIWTSIAFSNFYL